jgi:hypothetical protein
MIYYKPKYFKMFEYIPKDLYLKYKHKGDDWFLKFINPHLLWTDDKLRERFGKMYINTWKWNGDRNWSGLRTSDSSFYSITSQHSFGNASDKIFESVTAQEVIEDIKVNQKLECYKYITRLEDKLNMNWVHTDCANINNSNGILIFKG